MKNSIHCYKVFSEVNLFANILSPTNIFELKYLNFFVYTESLTF